MSGAKNGKTGKRQLAPGKSVSEQFLQFGEPVTLPGGVSTARLHDAMYKPGEADTAGPPLPRGSLYDR